MRIPSYDDLTPSIPDVSPGEVFTAADRVLPESGPVAARVAGCVPAGTGLFAALHGRDGAALVAIARDFSPRIERHGEADVVLDVSGLERLLGDPRTIGSELRRAGAPQVAVAPTQIAARLAARARPGLSIVDRDVERALGEVPLAVLQRVIMEDLGADAPDAAGSSSTAIAASTPAGPSTSVAPAFRPATVDTVRPPNDRLAKAAVMAHARKVAAAPTTPAGAAAAAAAARAKTAAIFDVLRRWGLTTLGELAALPADALSARIGREGVALQALARGLDPRPLVPDPAAVRFVQAMALEWPIDALEPLSFVLARLLDPLAAALARADRAAAAIRLDLRLTDRASHSRLLQLPAAMRDPRVLRTLLLLDLESHPPAAAIDVVTIEVDPAPARIIQYSLLQRALPSAETVATLNARLGALVGDARCGSPVLLDTHRPDAFEMRRFDAAEGTTRAVSAARPEGTAGAAYAAEASLMLRRCRPPVAVRVAVERGRPARVAIERRGMPGGAVVQAAGPWRTSGDWWDARRWNRDEWDVALADGTVCRLYRDRDSEVWFLEGTFD